MDREVIEQKLESLRRCLHRVAEKCPSDPATLSRDPITPMTISSSDSAEQVEVVRGSLQGVRAILLRKEKRHRLVLGVRLIQQAAAVEIDVNDVVPVQ